MGWGTGRCRSTVASLGCWDTHVTPPAAPHYTATWPTSGGGPRWRNVRGRARLPRVSEALRDLGEGLVLRRGRAADAEALAAFNADVLRPQDATEPNATMAAWTRDLFTGRHPTFTPDQATVVEHRPSGAIVSSALLISQTWSFAGVPIRVGQPELVGTHVDYRGRGLVRAQFEVLHRW